MDEKNMPPEAIEALEDLRSCSFLLHTAFEAAIEHARDYSEKEGIHNPWLYADLVRNKALAHLQRQAAEYGIRVEQLPNAGIRLTVNHRYFWVRKAGNEEKELGQYVDYMQLTLPGFELLGFVRKPNMVLLWIVDSMRDFAGFEIARPLSSGKMAWSYPVPQPINDLDKAVSETELQGNQSQTEEDLPIYGEETLEGEAANLGGTHDLWSTVIVSDKRAN